MGGSGVLSGPPVRAIFALDPAFSMDSWGAKMLRPALLSSGLTDSFLAQIPLRAFEALPEPGLCVSLLGKENLFFQAG